MSLREKVINALGGTVPERTKTNNAVLRGANDFLRFGSRGKPVLPPDWSEVKMSDEDVYRGYPYAVIQKRANKVATLAKENLNTWAKPEILDQYQKVEKDVVHPYLRLIEDSDEYSVKQFWKTICIYLDLAGAYYLGVVRNKLPSRGAMPDIIGSPQKFMLLNPYRIKRVLDKNREVAGYLETRQDGKQREWPAYMIIPMRELNPFDEEQVWSMTDAAKEATYTLQQSGNYTRETLNGNLNAPGIMTTDVILDDAQFQNFTERVRQHRHGEPVFGNGAGAITWNSMQTDLDKAALLDINEINRTTLFAVSGTSKTSLGIEQSGTTRETARVQVEQFISDTAQPRLEDIIDYLNLDYKKYYPKDYKQTGYWIEIQSAASRDYATETQATQMRQAQSALAFDLMQKGYTTQSSYDYAEGKIELAELELEKGIDKPQNPEQTPPENTPSDASESSVSDESSKDDTNIVSEENKALKDLEGLEPHSDLIENGGKGSGNFGHVGRPGEVGGSGKGGVSKGVEEYLRSTYFSRGQLPESHDEIVDTILERLDKRDIDTWVTTGDYDAARALGWESEKSELDTPITQKELWEEVKKQRESQREDVKRLENSKKVNSLVEEHDHEHCDCGKVEVLMNELGESEGKTLEESYEKFLNDLEEIQKETYKACISKLTKNAFDIDDIIGKVKKKTLTNKLKELIQNYWWILTPLFANSVLEDRNTEFGENVKFVFTNALQRKIGDNATKVADGHMNTILNDVLSASNKAYTAIVEDKAAELIVKAYKDNHVKYQKYFEEQPSMTEALKAIRNTDILEENRRIYERANELAIQGYKRSDIVKKIREEYNHLSEERAKLIAQNETSRAYGHTQYEADYQFLNSVGQLDTAMKRWVSMRPANEQDKICPLCQYLIDMGPIPFTQNFLSLGDTITVNNDNKVYNFTCNYEDIKGSTAHPRCMCRYELILNGKTLNDIDNSPDDSNDGDSGGSDNNVDKSAKSVNGGKGSGNFGHQGRPGKVGGSSNISVNVSESAKHWFEKRPKTREIFDKVVNDFEKIGLKRGFTLTSTAFDVMTEEEKKNPFSLGTCSGRTRTDTATSGSIVYISPDVFDESFGQKYSFEKDGNTSFTDHTFEGILRHELGHLFVTQLWLEETKPKGELSGGSFENFNGKLATESGANLPGLLSTGKWSYYASVDKGETIAEAFSNPDFSEDTRKVYEYVSNYKPKRKNDVEIEHGTIIYPCTGYPSSEEDLVKLLESRSAKQVNGGKGSGNFGHAGRPGEVGGSASESVGANPIFDDQKHTLDFDIRKVDNIWKQVDDGVGEWTEEEKDLSDIYYGSGYHNINLILRGEENPVPGNEERYQKAIKTLNDRLEKSSLKNDTMLYRGVNLSDYVKEDSLPNIGDEISYGGFSSASVDPEQSLRWGASRSKDSPAAMMLAIKAKKGSKAIKRWDKNEYEVTLPPNAKLKVVGRHLAYDVPVGEGRDSVDKVYILEVEYE